MAPQAIPRPARFSTGTWESIPDNSPPRPGSRFASFKTRDYPQPDIVVEAPSTPPVPELPFPDRAPSPQPGGLRYGLPPPYFASWELRGARRGGVVESHRRRSNDFYIKRAESDTAVPQVELAQPRRPSGLSRSISQEVMTVGPAILAQWRKDSAIGEKALQMQRVGEEKEIRELARAEWKDVRARRGSRKASVPASVQEERVFQGDWDDHFPALVESIKNGREYIEMLEPVDEAEVEDDEAVSRGDRKADKVQIEMKEHIDSVGILV